MSDEPTRGGDRPPAAAPESAEAEASVDRQRPAAPEPTEPLTDFEEIQALARGFWSARVLLTAVELDLFSALAGQSLHDAELAERLGADLRGVTLLANALVATGVLERHEDRYANSPAAHRYLDHDSPEYRGEHLKLAGLLWERWSRLTAVVREGSGAIGPEWGEQDTRTFVMAMHHAKPGAGEELVGALDLHGVRRAIDLGGGAGTFSEALALALPEAQVVLVDLPDAIAVARERIPAGLREERIVLVERDILEEGIPLAGTAPGPYDLALLSSVLHIFSPDDNVSLLGHVYEALEPGGQVVVREFLVDASGTQPETAALFGVNMLVNTEAGRAYSFEEIREWLHRSGFGQVEQVPLDGPTGLVVGRRA